MMASSSNDAGDTAERKAQKEAGLLLLREQDENDVSGDRKGLKAAERRRRRRNVLRALAEPRNRREKVQEPIYTTTKPAKNPTAFDDNLPSVASRQPRDSTFVGLDKTKGGRSKGGGRPGDVGRRPLETRAVATEGTAAAADADMKLGSSLLNALDGGASHFEPQDSLASVFGTVQPERGEDSLRSVFGARRRASRDAAAQAQALDVRGPAARGSVY